MKTNRCNRFLSLLGRVLLSGPAIVMSFFGVAQATSLTWDTSPGTVGVGNGAITGGVGAWNTTVTLGNWTADAGANNIAWVNANNDGAVFGGTAGTVTVTTVTANSLTFNTAGYIVTGSTLTLAGSTPTITANVDATISSILAGSAGLVKAGTGQLTLTGVNTYTTATSITGGTLRLGDGTTQPTINSTYATSTGATTKIQYTSAGSAAQTWSKFTGAGTLTLATAKNFDTGWGSATLPTGFTGNLRIEGGRVSLLAATGAATNYGLGAATKITVTNGGHLGMWETGITLPSTMAFDIAGTGYGETGYEGAVRMANSGLTSTINGLVTLTGNATIGAVGTGVIAQGIGQSTVSNLTLGTSSMTGTMELRGANTYTGTTNVAKGTLLIGSSAGTSSASIYGGSIVNQLTVTAGAVARFASTGVAHTISGTVGGTGTINVSGTSTTAATLNVASGAVINPIQVVAGDAGIGSYNQTGGTVTVGASGVWAANNAGGSGSSISVTGGVLDAVTGTSVLGVRGSYSFTVGGTGQVNVTTLQLGHTGGTNNNPAGRISNLNTGGTLKVNTGIVYAGATNNSTAVFNLNGGKLQAGASTSSLWNNDANVTANVGTGGALIDTQAFNDTITQNLRHDPALGATLDGGLTKIGSGSLVLSGALSYTGPTNVNAGSLTIPELSSTSSISVANGAALAVTGSTGTTIGGVSPLTSVTLGSTPAAGGASVTFGNFASNPSAPLIYGTSLTTNAAAGGIALNLSGGIFTGSGQFPLVWYDDASIGGDGIGAFTLGTLPRNVSATLVDDPQQLTLDVTAFNPTIWVGNVNSTWDVNTTSNWSLNAVSSTYLDPDIVSFDGTGTAAVSLNTTVTPSGILASGTHTISGTGAIAGVGGIIKNGSTTFSVNTSNTFTGPVSINGGTLKIGNANALGATGVLANTTVASGAVLDLNGIAMAAEALTLNGNGISSAGALINSSGTSASTASPITLASNSSLGGSGNMSLSGVISGGTNSLTKVGAGTVSISTQTTYTGGTTVNAGVLNLTGGGGAGGAIRGTATVNAGASLLINTGDATGYDLNTPRLTSINLVGGNMHVNTTANQTLGAATFNMTGATLTGVSGSNFDFFTSDNVQPNRSALNTLASSTTSVVSGVKLNLRQNDGVIFNIADGAAAIDFDVQSNISSSAFTNNQLVKNGAGTMRISGLSTYAYPTVINAGNLIVPVAQSSTAYTLADDTTLGINGAPGTTLTTTAMTFGTVGSTTLNINNFGSQTLPANAPVKTTGLMTINGTPTININGSFTAAGVFPVVKYGSLGGAADFVLGTLPRSVSGASLAFNSTNSTYDLTIGAVNAVFWNGNIDGTWDTSTTNWLLNAAPTAYQDNDVVVMNDSAAGVTAITLSTTVTPNSLTVDNTTKTYSIAGTGGMVGTGFLTKTGTGTLTLAANNSYTGGTFLNAGTLQLGNGTIDGTLAGDVVNNASLVANTTVSQTFAGIVSGTGTLGKTGAGTFILSTAPTYTGATSITTGTLQVPALSATSSITDNANLTFNRVDTTQTNVAGIITGTGSVSYTGPAVLTSLQGQYLVDDANTYGGTTSITNSRVNLTAVGGLSTGAVTINNGGQILFSGASGPAMTVTNPLTINGLGWTESAGTLGALRLNNGVILSGGITLGSNSRISTYSSWGTISSVISGGFGVEYTSDSNGRLLTLSGSASNTYTGTTTVTSGQIALAKTGGALAIPGDIVMDNVASPQIWVTADNQVTGTNLLTFTGNSGNARFDLMGTTQTFRGLVNNSTAATAVIQNSEAIGGGVNASPLNSGTSNLVVNVPSGEDYSYLNCYLRDSTGVVNVVKNGLGRQTLGGGTTIDYTGTTAVNVGELRFLDMDDSQSRAITIASGATLRVEAVARTFNGNIRAGSTWSGAGSLIMTGAGIKQFNGSAAGTLSLSMASGTTVDLQQGVLRLGFGGSFNSANNRADLNVASGTTFNTWDTPTSNEVRFDALTGSGTVTRGYTPDAGVTSTGTGNFAVGVDNGSGSFTGVIADQVGNVGSVLNLVKRGSGTQTLTGANTYHGTTTIADGTLALSGSGSIDNTTAMTIASGAVLDVSATTSGSFTQLTGRTLTGGRTSGSGNDIVGKYTSGGTVNVVGIGTVGTLSVSSDLSLTGGGTLPLDLSSNVASGNDKILSGGTLSLAGTTTITPSFNGTPDTTNPYTLITATGGLAAGDATNLVSGLTNSRYALAFDTTTTPGSVLMNVTGTGKSLVWSGGAANTWVAATTPVVWNTSTDYFQNLDSVVFDDTNVTSVVTLNSVVNPISVTVGTAGAGASNYTISGSGSIAGAGTLTKTGTGLLQLSTANTFGGGIVISQGSLQTGNNTAAGTGTITLCDANTGANNVSWKFNGSGLPANNIVVANQGSGTVTLGTYSAGSSTIHSGTMSLNRAVTLNDSTGDRTSFSGKISGNVGDITITGTRVTLDNSANDFAGNITINAGSILQASGVGGSIPDATNLTVNGTFKLNTTSTNETISGLSGASTGIVQNHESVSGTPTLTVGNLDATASFAGSINNGSGVLSLIKIGSGTQTLGGAGNFIGSTRILGGTLALTNLSALAGSTLVRDSEGGTLDVSTLTTGTLNFGGLRGGQDLTLSGLSLNIGHASNTDSTVYTGTLTLTGAGLGLTKAGLGNLTLGGSTSNSWVGNTSVTTTSASPTTQASLYLAKTGGAVAIPAGPGIRVNLGTGTNAGQANLRTLYNNQFGAGAIVNFGNNTSGYTRFDLLGTTQTLAGVTSLNNAAGAIIQNSGLGRYTGITAGAATLTLNGDTNADPLIYPVGGYVYAGILRDTDDGANSARQLHVVKNGTGTQTFLLNSASAGTGNALTGTTTVNAGTLIIARATGDDYYSSTGYVVASGATLELSNTAAAASGARLCSQTGDMTGAGTLRKTGTGITYLANNAGTQIFLNFGSGGLVDVQGGTLNSLSPRSTNRADVQIAGGASLTINGGGISAANPAIDALNGGSSSSNAILDLGRTTVIGIDDSTGIGTYFGNITGAGGLTKEGSGTMTLTGANAGSPLVPTCNSSFSGNIIVNGGKLVGAAVRTGSNSVFGLASNTRTITVNAGTTIEFDAPNTFGNHNTTAAPTLVVNGGTVTNGDPLATGKINNGLRDVTLNNGTLTSTAANSISTIDVSRPGEGYGAWGLNGTLTSTGTSQITTTDVSSAAGRILLHSGGVDTTFAVTSGILTVAVPLQGGDGPIGGLNKTGAGRLVLSAANIYSGPTTVGAGTVELNGSLVKASALLLPSNITVASGATLKGTGTAEGTLAANGIIAPGNSIGTLAVGATTFGSTGSLSAEINSSTATADKLAVTGDLTLDAASSLALTDLGSTTLTATTKLVLLTYSGTWNSVPFAGMADDSSVTVGTNTYVINYNDTDGGLNAVTLTFTSADPFGAWATLNGVTGGKAGDDDGDGSINLLEFATNSDPKNAGAGPRIYPLMHVIGADDALTYTLAVRKSAVFAAAANPDQKKQTATKDKVIYLIEASNDMVTWNAVEVTEVTGGDAAAVQTDLGAKLTAPAIGTDWEWRTFRTDGGSAVDPNDFIRLKVTEAP